MITSFKHKGLRNFYEKGDKSGIPAHQARKIQGRLTVLAAAAEIKDMNQPGYNLHQLKGELYPFWSVKLSGNWRIIFKFESGKASEVSLIDYH